ncbi:fibronectin [Strongylocentrotus purpuratus]|uniref:Fibronectin type-III domain-containing protein n=1 Tax=Strongylocentrotus purpuratus TaxID=7668 RepID=A0A7M7P0M1_STRPU|nr:fibronectin [Strongylocentrotus purpuratus]
MAWSGRHNFGKPRIDPREPGTIDVEGVTSTSISVTWTKIAGITDYIVNLTLASNNTKLFSKVIRSSLKASFSGLMPGEEYIIKIELQCAGEVLSLRQFTLPLELVCAVFTWVTEDSVTLQWSRPESQLFGYEIMYDDGSGPYSPINVFDRNSLQLERTIMGLMDGPGVEVNITTLAGAGMAQTRSNPVKISPNPREPWTIDVEGVTSTSILVTWTEIAGITDYIANLNLASNNTELFSGVIRSSLKASFSGLMPGEEYIIKIELQCDGEVLSLRQFTLPLEPVCAVFTWVTEDSVTLQWSRPESKLFGYEIMYDDGSGPYSPINVFDSNSVQLERTITGLMDGPGVEVNITTLAGAGMAQTRSNPVKISPNQREPGTIDVEEVTSTSISITWTEIAGITDHIVNLTLASNNTKLFSEVIRSSLKASFLGLMPGEEYIIEIELQCVREVLSLRQFTLPLEPVCAIFTWVTEDSVTLQWSRPESQLFGYEIMYDDGSGPYSPINVFDRNSLQLERTIMGLMDGPGVEVNITTLAGAGMAQTRSNPVKISPNPREPGTIDVEEVTSTSISITWSEIAGITDFIVNLNLASNNTKLFSEVIRSSLKASFSGLMPGEEYIIEIELQCAGEVLSLRQFTLPLAPVRVVFTLVTVDSVTLQWSRPESKLVGYEIMYDDGSGPYSPINVFDGISLQLERTIMGLMDGPGVEVNITTLAGAGMAQTRSNPVKISPIPTTTSSPTVSSPPKSTSAGGSSISIVVGSAVGAILVIVVVIVLIIILYKRRSNESATSKSEGRESKLSPQYENPVFDQSQTDAHIYQDLNTIHTYQDCNNDDQSYDDTVDPHTYQEPDQEANYEELNDAKEKNSVNSTMIKQYET